MTTISVIHLAYFFAAAMFMFGLKAMSSPARARRGIVWAGLGMVLATLVTFLHPEVHRNYFLILLALACGGGGSWWVARTVSIKNMPQMIAFYNAMGGGSAASIAVVALTDENLQGDLLQCLGVIGALLGCIAFTGSILAFFKLKGTVTKVPRFSNMQVINLGIMLIALLLGLILSFSTTAHPFLLVLYFVLALACGVIMTLPIGSSDMPVVVSLFNAMAGLAVAFEGFAMQNPAMMVAGVVVGASGWMLTSLMAKSMNRPVATILFSDTAFFREQAAVNAAALAAAQSSSGVKEPDASAAPAPDSRSVWDDKSGEVRTIDTHDAAVDLAYAEKVVIVPGYGMALSHAQQKLWELTEVLERRGVKVSFAIHPVAGRMPGHMNVLLAEAGVPYEKIVEIDDINPEFASVDVVLVVGANDTVNPSARTDTDSPIYGMPILDVDKANHVIVMKRGQGAGFSGIDNPLFTAGNTRLLYGDAQRTVQSLISGVRDVES